MTGSGSDPFIINISILTWLNDDAFQGFINSSLTSLQMAQFFTKYFPAILLLAITHNPQVLWMMQ